MPLLAQINFFLFCSFLVSVCMCCFFLANAQISFYGRNSQGRVVSVTKCKCVTLLTLKCFRKTRQTTTKKKSFSHYLYTDRLRGTLSVCIFFRLKYLKNNVFLPKSLHYLLFSHFFSRHFTVVHWFLSFFIVFRSF